MTLQTLKPSELTLDAIHMAVIGDSGSGKTGFAGQWPKSVHLDFDCGALRLKGDPKCQDAIIVNKPRVIDAHGKPKRDPWTWKEVIDAIINPWQYRRDAETLVIDSWTFMMRDIFWEICAAKNRIRPTMDEFGLRIERGRTVLDKIRVHPLHIVSIAHPRIMMEDGEDDMPKISYKAFSAAGKDLPGEIPASHDYVGWMRKAGDAFLIDFIGNPMNAAKARYGKLGSGEPADFEKLYAKITGKGYSHTPEPIPSTNAPVAIPAKALP